MYCQNHRPNKKPTKEILCHYMYHAKVRDPHYLVESISRSIPVKQSLTERPDHPPGICEISASSVIKEIGHKEVCDLRNSLTHVSDFDIYLYVSIRLRFSSLLYRYWVALDSISICQHDCRCVAAQLNFICIS